MNDKLKHIGTIFCFVILIVFLIVGQTYAKTVRAIYDPTPTPKPTPAVIQYDLAFPGMLPDNSFYKLKVLRDKIQLIMTTDALKRIDLLLRYADKGILASAMLVDKNEWDLAQTTALKAENNMTLLTPELYRLDEPIDQILLKKLLTASLKHQEVLAKLMERVPEDKQFVFLQVIEFSKRNQTEIEKFVEQENSLK